MNQNRSVVKQSGFIEFRQFPLRSHVGAFGRMDDKGPAAGCLPPERHNVRREIELNVRVPMCHRHPLGKHPRAWTKAPLGARHVLYL